MIAEEEKHHERREEEREKREGGRKRRKGTRYPKLEFESRLYPREILGPYDAKLLKLPRLSLAVFPLPMVRYGRCVVFRFFFKKASVY
jgi:hypothetical protein